MINVMLAGLPGSMASMVLNALCFQPDISVTNIALGEYDMVFRGFEIVEPSAHKLAIEHETPDIIVDFTVPSAVNSNAELYCNHSVPFIMGTTGGDRQKLVETVKKSDISAVIAPNMAEPIIMILAMMEYAATNFPGLLKKYKLVIQESHQTTKKDTSGTAKAMVKYFNQLGIKFTEDQIIMERDPVAQEKDWHVPHEHLAGHGYHRYQLLSPDSTVLLEIVHNVNGRQVYVPGVLRAIRFLAARKEEKGKVYSMVDVLRG